MPVDAAYLGRTRKHIAVIGRFSAEPNAQKCIATDYEGAKDAFAKLFGIYRHHEERSPNDTVIDLVKLVTARGVQDPAVKSDDRVELSGTPLEGQILGAQNAREAGGELFVELLDALDNALPFSHPSFDLLLTEVVVGFYMQAPPVEHLTEDPLRELVMTPEVNASLLAWLRGGDDVASSKRYRSTFEAVVREAAESNAWFTEASISLGKDQIEGLAGVVERLRTVLGAAASGKEEGAQQLADALEAREGVFQRLIADVPVGPEAGRTEEDATVPAQLTHLFRTFHDNRKVVDQIASSEPCHALMMAWSFGKLGNGQTQQTDAIWKCMYGDAADALVGLTPEKIAERNREHRTKLERMRKLYPAGSAQRTALKVMIEQLAALREGAYSRTPAFYSPQLVTLIVETTAELAMLLVPGMTEFRDKAKKVIEGNRAVFGVFEGIRGNELTTDDLIEKIDTEIVEGSELDGWWKDWKKEQVGELSGIALANRFEEAYLDWEVEMERDAITKFLDDKKEDVEALKSNVKAGCQQALLGLGEDGTLQAPPGGAVAGIVDPGSLTLSEDGTALDRPPGGNRERDQERRIRRQQVASGGARGDGGPTSQPEELTATDAREAENVQKTNQDTDEDSGEHQERGAESGSGGDGGDGGDVVHKANKDGTDPPGEADGTESDHPFPLAPEEQAEAEQNLEDLHAKLLGKDRKKGEIGLLSLQDSALAGQRAKMRMKLLAMHVLAHPKTRLGKRDVSIGTHFVLRMVEAVGAAAEFEGQNRRELTKPGAGRECGFANMNFKKVLQELVPPDARSGRVALQGFLSAWRLAADDILGLRADLNEWTDLNELFNDLAECRDAQGQVTIFNETLAEHAKRVATQQGSVGTVVGSPGNRKEGLVQVSPPGVVYVTQQAFGKKDAKDLSAVDDLIRGQGRSPFHPDANGLTRLQGYTAPFQGKCVWSLPVFVGVDIQQDGNSSLPLPLISLPQGVSHPSGAVVCLAGIHSGRPRWTCEVQDAEAGFRAMAKGVSVDEGNYLGEAWWAVLSTDELLTALCLSKVVTHGLAQRVSTARAPSFEAAVYDMVQDCGGAYRAFGARGEKLRQKLRVLIGEDYIELPQGRGAMRVAAPELKVGELDTRCDRLFSLV